MRKKKRKKLLSCDYLYEKLRIFDDSKIIQNVIKNCYPT